ncbi:UNVERIFIED_ORG: putative TPR repeat methyltransferase [Xanthobacter viscosus]|uniref:Methyltransferase domain-containing protein n=1 Tax=Xanthobacter autotrophicus TaxID=280 RepID=A0A6C1KIG0_XANAU|nr:methyltransferase domain-containing protein [Xanthobacter autotrophicus]TLX42904.1 methyltransferase domain-containing protein [Xanthobacter autotrophicus]
MAHSAFTLLSGDPVLDRRLDWARAFLAEGDASACAELLAETVTDAPHFAAAWFLLGEARAALADRTGAAEAFERVRALDPDDALGAGLHLARLGAAPAEGAMSAAYVRTLFDQYADRFDTALRDKLAYRGPELLFEALTRAAAARGRTLDFAEGLDLGCGTGLAGVLFATVVERLAGVDLSPAMLEKAAGLGLYARLEAGEMGAALEAVPEVSLDLILAADALCYVADLAPIFHAARRVLRADGLFAFTLETHEGDGVILRDTLRYAHSADHVRALAHAAGLAIVLLEAASTRAEKGVAVPGLVCVLG